MVYINAQLKPITLEQGKIYNVPDKWGVELIKNECAYSTEPIKNEVVTQ